MFQLDYTPAKLVSVNPRAELHGDETEPACDIKFKVTLGNAALDMFDTRLLPALFDAPPDGYEGDLADQGTDHPDDFRPFLRFREMTKLNWDYKGAGYRLVIDRGLDEKSNIYLIKTQIDKFKFELKQGGSVEMEFRVIAHPNADDFGKLCVLVAQEVDITLEPPSAEERAQMELDEMSDDDQEPQAA